MELMPTTLRHLVCILAVSRPLLAQVSPVPANTLKLEDFLEAEQVRDFFRGGGPEISPDGKHVVYTRWWVDKQNDEWKASLWLIGSDGTRNRWLVDGRAQ